MNSHSPPPYLTQSSLQSIDELFILALPAQILRGLPPQDDSGRDICGWFVHKHTEWVFLPLYIDVIDPDSIYCLACDTWRRFGDSINNIERHIKSNRHQQLARAEPTRHERIRYFEIAMMSLGRPFSDADNEWIQLAIPGLSRRKVLTQECTNWARETRLVLARKLQQCEFHSIQYDVWKDRANRRFVGVMRQALDGDDFFQCNLALIPAAEEICGGILFQAN
jgi:hypothetical protein